MDEVSDVLKEMESKLWSYARLSGGVVSFEDMQFFEHIKKDKAICYYVANLKNGKVIVFGVKDNPQGKEE